MVFVTGKEGDMARDQLDGPPWGNPVDPDEAYVRGQARSAGSGLLGGESQAWYGGAVEGPGPLQKEIRRTIAELTRARLPAPSTGEPET
jgi:hypothetical protein